MFKKFYLFAIISTLFLVNSTFAQNDEGLEGAVSSNLTNISLPTGAMRVLPDSIPAEVNETLEKIIAQSNRQLQQGETEVLIWMENNLKKTGKTTIINRLTDSLKVDGWQYEVAEENGVSIFSLLKDGKQRRAIIGFYGEIDETLVFAWAELLKADSGESFSQKQKTVSANNTSNGFSGSLVGTWSNGSTSMINRQNTVTGAITPGRSSRYEYKFMADGRFQSTGILQMTNYSCTDVLYSETAGKYSLSGSTLTLTQTKNYWKKTNSCSPKSNSEKNQPLTKEIYQFSTKTDEYNQELICLTNNNGESCFRKQK